MKSIIAITSDFGDQLASAQLAAVLASYGFDGQLIENHSVSAFSILEGAFHIAIVSQFLPVKAVHLGVVDPGVGSYRRGIIIKTATSWFVGPDNGLLYPAALAQRIISTWKIDESAFGLVSRTFHGRDIFIKTAALLAGGKLPSEFGCQEIDASSLCKFEFQKGQVVHVDHYGNIKIYWPYPLFLGDTLHLVIGARTIDAPVVATFADVPAGKPLAYFGSSNTLELAVNLGRGDRFFGFKVGDQVKIA